MQPLEVLVSEEESVIAAEIEGQRLSSESGLPTLPSEKTEMLRLLPHMAHQPYFTVLVAMGAQLTVHEAVSRGFPPDFLEVPNSNLTSDLNKITQQIRGKYAVEVTPQDIKTYLVGFAGRILDYARSNPTMQSILANTLSFSQRVAEANQGLSEEHAVPAVMQQLQESTAHVAYFLEQIKRFHESAR